MNSSGMKRQFAVSAVKSLGRSQAYVIVLDFTVNTVNFHKVRRGKEVKRSFPFHQCVKLDKHNSTNVPANSTTTSTSLNSASSSSSSLLLSSSSASSPSSTSNLS